MQRALQRAQDAAAAGEVPIGAVLTYQGEIVAEAANRCVAESNPLLHAETLVLQQALQRLNQTQMRQASLYVTLEPCPMCMGAILHSHLGRLVFAAYNLKWGCCGTVSDFRQLFPAERLEIVGGIEELAASALLHDFFYSLRSSDS